MAEPSPGPETTSYETLLKDHKGVTFNPEERKLKLWRKSNGDLCVFKSWRLCHLEEGVGPPRGPKLRKERFQLTIWTIFIKELPDNGVGFPRRSDPAIAGCNQIVPKSTMPWRWWRRRSAPTGS